MRKIALLVAILVFGVPLAWAANNYVWRQDFDMTGHLIMSLGSPLGVGVSPATDRSLQAVGNVEGNGVAHHFGVSSPLQTSGDTRVLIGQPQDPYPGALPGIAAGDGILIQAGHSPAGVPHFQSVSFYRRCDNDTGNTLMADVDVGGNVPNQGENSLMLEAWGTVPGGGCGNGGLASIALIADHDGLGNFIPQWQWLFEGSRGFPAVAYGGNPSLGYYFPDAHHIVWSDGTKDTFILDTSASPLVQIPNGGLLIDDSQTPAISPYIELQTTVAPLAGDQIGVYHFAAENGTGFIGAGGVAMIASENWSAGNTDSYMTFSTTIPVLGAGERMRLSPEGNLLLGTTSDSTAGPGAVVALRYRDAVDDPLVMSGSGVAVTEDANGGYSVALATQSWRTQHEIRAVSLAGLSAGWGSWYAEYAQTNEYFEQTNTTGVTFLATVPGGIIQLNTAAAANNYDYIFNQGQVTLTANTQSESWYAATKANLTTAVDATLEARIVAVLDASTGNDWVSLGVVGSVDTTHLVLSVKGGGGLDEGACTSTAISGWHDYALAYNGTTVVAYVDGVAAGCSYGNTHVTTNPAYPWIGLANGATAGAHHVQVDKTIFVQQGPQ